MNQEIKDFIIAQCKRQDMEMVEDVVSTFGIAELASPIELCCANEFASVMVKSGHMDEMYFFEYWNQELSPELLYRFPIPETIRGFQQVCNILKIFH